MWLRYDLFQGGVRVAAFLTLLSAAGCGWVGVTSTGSGTSSTRPNTQASISKAPNNQPKPIVRSAKSRKVRGNSVQVVPGDTVYALSRQYRVPVQTIIETNRLAPPHHLFVGQWIALPKDKMPQEASPPTTVPRATVPRETLPQPKGHVVTDGETLYGVSRLYKVDPHALARANNLTPPYELRNGQRLTIPTGDMKPVATKAQPEVETEALPKLPAHPRPAIESASKPSAVPTTSAAGILPPTTKISQPPPSSRSGFMWPVQGEVISRFGTKTKGLRNDGINIAAKKGTPIKAAENGVVAYAGNELRGFGNMILIKHANGWVTAYAHTEVILVGRGDKVRKGQVIAKVGTSGGVSRPQLHFEIRKGKKAVDPTKHLGRNTA